MLKKLGLLNLTTLAKCEGVSMHQNDLTADQMAMPIVVL